MSWSIERDSNGEPSRLIWNGVAQCLHTKTRKGKPELKEFSVNVSEFCVQCGERVAVVSWERSAWDDEQQKRSDDAQIQLFERD